MGAESTYLLPGNVMNAGMQINFSSWTSAGARFRGNVLVCVAAWTFEEKNLDGQRSRV
jgi:hypothetical protein